MLRTDNIDGQRGTAGIANLQPPWHARARFDPERSSKGNVAP